MLKQLAHLSLDTDGRYATDGELQFLEDYLESIDTRMSAYQKIHDSFKEIVLEVEKRQSKINPKLYFMGSRDTTEICRRDLIDIFCCSAANMLFDDLDRLRDAVLIWYKTIVEAFGYKDCTKITYQVLQEVVAEYLTPEEMELMLPFLKLNETILSP
jgi:hypothetical protein